MNPPPPPPPPPPDWHAGKPQGRGGATRGGQAGWSQAARPIGKARQRRPAGGTGEEGASGAMVERPGPCPLARGPLDMHAEPRPTACATRRQSRRPTAGHTRTAQKVPMRRREPASRLAGRLQALDPPTRPQGHKSTGGGCVRWVVARRTVPSRRMQGCSPVAQEAPGAPGLARTQGTRAGGAQLKSPRSLPPPCPPASPPRQHRDVGRTRKAGA